MKTNFEPIPTGEEDCVMTIADWQDCVRTGLFIDYDGYGYYATDKEMSSDHVASPSKMHEAPPSWATHVVWFNR